MSSADANGNDCTFPEDLLASCTAAPSMNWHAQFMHVSESDTQRAVGVVLTEEVVKCGSHLIAHFDLWLWSST